MLKPGTWQPTGANDANLRAMIANPADLEGRPGIMPGNAALPATAVDRMLAGKTPALAPSASGGGS